MYIKKPSWDISTSSQVSNCNTYPEKKQQTSKTCILCGVKNKCLKETFSKLNIMLRLNESKKAETLEKHFHVKGFDAMNIENQIHNILTNS